MDRSNLRSINARSCGAESSTTTSRYSDANLLHFLEYSYGCIFFANELRARNENVCDNDGDCYNCVRFGKRCELKPKLINNIEKL